MNWGLRMCGNGNGFGPVLLDYPYIYELDGAKLYCNSLILDTNMICDGMIDYDDGFNELICTKCGRKYLATDLEDKSNNIKVIIQKDEEEVPMKVVLKQGDTVLKTYDSNVTKSIDITNTDEVIGQKLRQGVSIKDRNIPKKMKRVDLDKEEKNKAKSATKKAEKIAQNLQDKFHSVNDGRFIEPDYSRYEEQNEVQQEQQQINNEPEIDYAKEFGLEPIKEPHKKKSGENPYLDTM